mmetsp:Transcript_8440/g.14971  ORF Transcript_8440/g.14971 Transcript_8440/m.14971 type:complete len:157 (+) Transcript_8440:3-473(+)
MDIADAAVALMARLDATCAAAGALEADITESVEICGQIQSTALRTAALRLARHSEALLEVLDAATESRADGVGALRDWRVSWLCDGKDEDVSESTELADELCSIGQALGSTPFAALKKSAKRPVDGMTRLTCLRALILLISESQLRRKMFEGVAPF